MALDIEDIRADFPILARTLPNGKRLVYFDNAATSQKPVSYTHLTLPTKA